MDDLVKRALDFAFEKHAGQYDFHGAPYYMHIVRVVSGTSALGANQPEILAAAALHDVVEDCEVTISEIVQRFGNRVAHLVDCLTHRLGEEYNQYIDRLDSDRCARIVKLVDLRDNSLPWRIVPHGRKQHLYAGAIRRLETGVWESQNYQGGSQWKSPA